MVTRLVILDLGSEARGSRLRFASTTQQVLEPAWAAHTGTLSKTQCPQDLLPISAPVPAGDMSSLLPGRRDGEGAEPHGTAVQQEGAEAAPNLGMRGGPETEGLLGFHGRVAAPYDPRKER